jgi:hypothetical protein
MQINSTLFMNGRATRASADINLVNDIRVIDKERMMGDRMRNGYVNCAPREGEGLNPMWHMIPFSKSKLGNGLDRLTRKSPRGTMLKYFRLLGKPYGFYTSGKHLFFYRAEFIVTEALIRRLLQRHRRLSSLPNESPAKTDADLFCALVLLRVAVALARAL